MKQSSLKSLNPILLKSEQGALQISLLLTLLILTLAGFGTWSLMRHWRFQVELQLRLDRCVGEKALDLKKTLNRIESINDRIDVLRIAIAAATLTGDSAPLVDLLIAVTKIQDLDLARWKLKQVEWIAKRGCDSARDLPMPLPSMHWVRPPPDLLGPQALQWQAIRSRPMLIRLHHSPRAAAAEVAENETEWRAKWSAP